MNLTTLNIMENLSWQTRDTCPVEEVLPIPNDILFLEYIPQFDVGDNFVHTFMWLGIVGLWMCWFVAQFCWWACHVVPNDEEDDDEDLDDIVTNTKSLEDGNDEDIEDDDQEQADTDISLVSQHVVDDVVEENDIVTPPNPITPREPGTPPKPFVPRRSKRLAQQRIQQQSTVLDVVNAFIDNVVQHNKLE